MSAWRDAPISIADDLFLVALDERTGRVRLHHHALSLGLAAALLAELTLLDHVGYADGKIKVPSGDNAAVTAHHRTMVDQIAAEPDHPVPIWLSFFAQTAPDVVAARLVARGFLRKEASRGLLRTKEAYFGTDESALAWRTLRLANVISRRDVRNWEDGMLVALLDATGLAEHVLWHGSPDDIGNLRDIVAGVSEDPFLGVLVAQVSALIAAGVMTQRK
ncbi:MAG TPA: GPP34 family phosphoprotein [Micromonosporaceae bacterium]